MIYLCECDYWFMLQLLILAEPWAQSYHTLLAPLMHVQMSVVLKSRATWTPLNCLLRLAKYCSRFANCISLFVSFQFSRCFHTYCCVSMGVSNTICGGMLILPLRAHSQLGCILFNDVLGWVSSSSICKGNISMLTYFFVASE